MMPNLQRRLKDYRRQQARKNELQNSLKKLTGFKVDLSQIPFLRNTFIRTVMVITVSAFIFYLINIPQTASFFTYLNESETVTISAERAMMMGVEKELVEEELVEEDEMLGDSQVVSPVQLEKVGDSSLDSLNNDEEAIDEPEGENTDVNETDGDLENPDMEEPAVSGEEEQSADLEEISSESLQGLPVTFEDDLGDSGQLGGDYGNEE